VEIAVIFQGTYFFNIFNKTSSFTYIIFLCRTQQEILKEESYEIDADPEKHHEERAHHDSITKQGYLLKGADTTDSVFAHIGSKSFKRRYCYLRSQIDGCYILELHKDEKQCDAKHTIVMDFCTEVLHNPRKGRFCFELKMTEGHKSVTFAAEDDFEMEDWIKKLSSVLQQNKIQEDRFILLKEKHPQPSNAYGTLKGLEQSVNPQLLKYSRETELTIAAARKENRKRLFGIIANQFTKSPSQPIVEPHKEVFGKRIFMKFESIKFRLQAPLDESENPFQIEPYITSMALFDLKAGRKLSESFYFDLNENHAREMMHVDNQDFTSNENDKEYSDEWISYPKQAVFNVTNPHPDIFAVIRIEKILQGSINASTEPYLKAQKEPKIGCKTLKIIKQYSQKLKQRSLITTMPWAFSAKPLFRLYSSELDTDGNFSAIFKQDCNKLKDEEIFKLLNDFRKPEKMNKLTVIPGSISVKISLLESVPKSKKSRLKEAVHKLRHDTKIL
jgi:dedicator of cytokinesis protein 9/10/11